jgi:hypothetical protein
MLYIGVQLQMTAMDYGFSGSLYHLATGSRRPGSAGRNRRHAPDWQHYLDIASKADFLPILCEKTATLAPLSSLYLT